MTHKSERTQRVIGLSLSGGGFRAAAFHLGVLKRLEDLHVLPHVSIMSVVSGGAITGTLYALRCAERGGCVGSYPVDALIAELRPLLSSNLRGRAFFGTPGRTVRTVLSFLVPLVQRTPLFVEALDDVYGGATLRDLPPWLVINATNLRTGKAWKFSRDLMGDYVVGACVSRRRVRVAEAVGASAAFPGLVDAFPLRTNWGRLDPRRIRRPLWPTLTPEQRAAADRWRARYGQPQWVRRKRDGRLVPNRLSVTMPLVDGGVYDNEGIVSLRAARVTHAIISSSASPGDDFRRGYPFVRELVRVANVMHARLGSATRSLSYESTHALHPTDVGEELDRIATTLEALAATNGHADVLRPTAARLRELAQVGSPPHSWQYRATAQIVLHRLDVANNVFATLPRNAIQIAPEHRGLTPRLLEELSRVRTDLDALAPAVVDLLIGQGYLMADAYVKAAMPDVLGELAKVAPAAPPLRSLGIGDGWRTYQEALAAANSDVDRWVERLRAENRRRVPVGRSGSWREWLRIWSGFLGGLTALALLAVSVAILLH